MRDNRIKTIFLRSADAARWRHILVIVALALLPMASGSVSADVLTVSKVSDNPKKHYKRLKPLVDYVAARMGDLGITGGEVLLASSEDEMVALMRDGTIDWVTETPFTAVRLEEEAGGRIILRKWKKGVPAYHSVIFVRKDSGIGSIDDLVGHRIAFEDPGSTSAYHMPAYALINRGYPLQQMASMRTKARANSVGYLFSGEEINTSLWVHKGIVDAGAISNTDWAKSDGMPERVRKQMHLIHETAPIPRALELVRGDLDPAVIERLEQLLVEAIEDPEAKAALEAYEGTTRFDRINDDIKSSLDEVRVMRKIMIETVN